MPTRGGRGIHDRGVRFHPGSDHGATYGTGGNADTRITADAFDLPGIREGGNIQDAMVFGKPDRGLDGRPIPFVTLQIEISLPDKGGEVVVMHGNAFVLDAVSMGAWYSGGSGPPTMRYRPGCAVCPMPCWSNIAHGQTGELRLAPLH